MNKKHYIYRLSTLAPYIRVNTVNFSTNPNVNDKIIEILWLQYEISMIFKKISLYLRYTST